MNTKYQENYWRELDQLKIHIFYLDMYLEKTRSIDRSFKILIAVTSSASIGGWAIWSEYSYVWGAIIATSQVINAIKIYLPYSKRLKALTRITGDLSSLFLDMENSWFDVSEGRLTENEIHRLHMQYKKQQHELVEKKLEDLPEKIKTLNKAKNKAKIYFNNFYGKQGG